MSYGVAGGGVVCFLNDAGRLVPFSIVDDGMPDGGSGFVACWRHP